MLPTSVFSLELCCIMQVSAPSHGSVASRYSRAMGTRLSTSQEGKRTWLPVMSVEAGPAIFSQLQAESLAGGLTGRCDAGRMLKCKGWVQGAEVVKGGQKRGDWEASSRRRQAKWEGDPLCTTARGRSKLQLPPLPNLCNTSATQAGHSSWSERALCWAQAGRSFEPISIPGSYG